MASLATSSPPKSKDVIFRVHPKLTFAKRSIFFDWECPCTESIMNSPCADHFVESMSCIIDEEDVRKCAPPSVEFQRCLEQHPEI